MATIFTLSQNNALYFTNAYCGETARQRAVLFRKFAAGARLQSLNIERRTFNDPRVSRVDGQTADAGGE